MSEQAETPIDVDGLDASLDDLLKAADASDVRDRLSKAVRGEHPGSTGYSAEYGGHVDESGQKGGGVASMSDAGSLDDLMIGKMIDAGVPAATVASFVAFMEGKAEDEDEDDDEELYRSGYGDGETLRKSYSDQFSEDDDIAHAVDASPFMEALTMRTTAALEDLHKSMSKSALRQDDFNGKMARAVGGLGKLVKSQSSVISELSKRLGIVERTPMPQKGVTGAQALQKSMPGEAGPGSGADRLTKGEVVNALTYMNLEKGIKTINGQKTGEMAVMLEAGGSIDRGTLEEVARFLQANPGEARLAKSYQ